MSHNMVAKGPFEERAISDRSTVRTRCHASYDHHRHNHRHRTLLPITPSSWWVVSAGYIPPPPPTHPSPPRPNPVAQALFLH